MSSGVESALKLPASSLDAARRYLRGSLDGARKRGEAAHRMGAISSVKPDAELPGYKAVVTDPKLGGREWHVDLQFLDGTWFGECTCSREFDCEHCYGAMMEVVEVLKGKFEASSSKKGKGKGATDESAAPPKGSFAYLAQERLGHDLSDDERAVANAVDRLYNGY